MKLTQMILCLTAAATLAGCATHMPLSGEKAPMVEGTDQDGHQWKLSDDIGRSVVLLYFYPKDNTPGCTKEACGFRDGMAEFKNQGVKVVGVSFDNQDSHQRFIFNYNLNFPLIADTDGEIADKYHVRRQPGAMMDQRVSFLIDLNGRIVHVTDSPNADAHLAEMHTAVSRLPKI